MSRCNSMTSPGQCRLAPLIPCIQDSSRLYDLLVKILFKLHQRLPPDTLSGHRERFLHQFPILRDFYSNASNLQYFKNLIQITPLPQVSFLIFLPHVGRHFYFYFSTLLIFWSKRNWGHTLLRSSWRLKKIFRKLVMGFWLILLILLTVVNRRILSIYVYFFF